MCTYPTAISQGFRVSSEPPVLCYVRLVLLPPQVESRLRADLGSRDSDTATLVALLDLGGRTGRWLDADCVLLADELVEWTLLNEPLGVYRGYKGAAKDVR